MSQCGRFFPALVRCSDGDSEFNGNIDNLVWLETPYGDEYNVYCTRVNRCITPGKHLTFRHESSKIKTCICSQNSGFKNKDYVKRTRVVLTVKNQISKEFFYHGRTDLSRTG